MDGQASGSGRYLIARSASRICALPLEQIVETMRPMPVAPVGDMPPFVQGLSIIRGDAVPVVDAGAFFGQTQTAAGRYVVLKLDKARRVALQVDEVIGVRDLPGAALEAVPPLLSECNAQAVAAVSALDGELLLVLRGARLLPEEAWRTIDAQPVRP